MSLPSRCLQFTVACMITFFGLQTDHRCDAQDFDQLGMKFAFAEFNDEESKLQIEVQWPRNQPEVDKAGMREETYDVTVPVTKVVPQTYTVKIPYTEVITKDGKSERVTKIRDETRTRNVTVTTMVKQQRVRKVPNHQKTPNNDQEGDSHPTDGQATATLTVTPSNFECLTVDGDSIPWSDAKRRLTKRQPVLLLGSDQELDQRLRPFFRDDLIIVRQNANPSVGLGGNGTR